MSAGEELYPLVMNMEPDLAGKITGMLLEMSEGDVVGIIEDHMACQDKVLHFVIIIFLACCLLAAFDRCASLPRSAAVHELVAEGLRQMPAWSSGVLQWHCRLGPLS